MNLLFLRIVIFIPLLSMIAQAAEMSYEGEIICKDERVVYTVQGAQ